MPRLQELILRLGLASVGELNRAIFSCPDSTLLAALEQTFGSERAEEMRAKISKAVQIPVLDDAEVKMREEILNVSALELTPLVTKYKALPLKKIAENNTDHLLLAMADPLVDEARQAFSQLFKLPVKCVLAREKAIMNAYALSAARLSLAARKEAAEHPESNMPSLAKHIEDPEVRKAIHQLTATAVKHNASLVVLETNKAYTRAQFTFADGMTSTVDISVSPVSVVTSLFRRGQIVSETPSSVKASCRVRFKSVSVNFVLECAKGNELPTEQGADPLLSARSVTLRSFILDDPDHPGFWDGIGEGSASALRELFEHPNGMFLFCASKPATKEFALRALAESYPDIAVVDVKEPLSERDDLFAQATERRVVAALSGADVFDGLRGMVYLGKERLDLVRGALSYFQLPRNCPFCSVPAVIETSVLLKIPTSFALPNKEFRRGAGCSLCEGRGILGYVGVSSVLNLAGYTGQVLASGGTYPDVLRALAKDSFSPLLEDGLHTAGLGRVPLPIVLSDLPVPPEEYLELRDVHVAPATSTSDSGPLPVVRDDDLILADEEPQPAFTPKPSVRRSVSSLEPLRGRDVFSSASATSSSGRLPLENDDDTDWLVPNKLKESPEPAPAPKERPAPSDGRPLLLVIDDDADQRAILRRVFEIAGYKVEVAADGIDGIVSAVRLEPQLIIVDFMMPELDGRETIRRLKHGPTTGQIPVVALTAYADPDVELGLLQAGADDFCPKSVSKQVLLKRVERLVRERGAS